MEGEQEKHEIVDGDIVVEDRLQGRTLTNLSTSFVKPSSETPREKEWLSPSNLDLLWTPYYTPLICTYTLEHKSASVSNIVQHLKDSLAQALVPFYPLAGRVVSGDGVPRIHCNDAGAVFTEADVDAELVELKTEDFQPLRLLSGMAPAGLASYPSLSPTTTDLPALVIQVTHFKCGGITLAANWAHVVADGKSGFHFMKSWSELARGAGVSLLPDHRRSLVKPREPPILSNPFMSGTSSAAFQDTPAEAPKDSKSGACTTEVTANEIEKTKPAQGSLPEDASRDFEAETTPEPKKDNTIQMKIFEFTEDDIAKLKLAASSDDATVQLTRADCLSAHLWRTIARARGLPSHARVRFWLLVEGRKKLSLPPGYFGNVIGIVSAKATVGEILSNPLSFTANLIHTIVLCVTPEWFLNLVDWVGAANVQSGLDPLGPGCESGASYLNHFPFYELDFGFGVPSYSIRNILAGWDGQVSVVPSSRSPRNMTAMVNLAPDVMTKFASLAYDFPKCS